MFFSGYIIAHSPEKCNLSAHAFLQQSAHAARDELAHFVGELLDGRADVGMQPPLETGDAARGDEAVKVPQPRGRRGAEELFVVLRAQLSALFEEVNQTGGSAIVLFDEIDAGIGGTVANAVGEEMKALSLSEQVIAIKQHTINHIESI